jgi:signal transduction histidine kinase/ActR/RegA family two-component response regulator
MDSRKTQSPIADAPAAADRGQDILAWPHIWRRIAVGGLIALASAPVLPAWLIAAWAFVWLLVCGWEQRAARAKGFVAANAEGLVVTLLLTCLQAAAAAALLARGDGASRWFAVGLIGFSSVNVMLRFYAAPMMMAAAMAPYAIVLGWVGGVMSVNDLRTGDVLRAMTPPATLALYALLLWPTRRHLLDGWLILLAAKTEAERASRAKSEFLATISHEIRTPLNGILGMAQALQAERPAPEQARRLQVIRSCGETLLAILNDVLDLSRIEAGQLRVEREAFDLEHVTRGAVATFGPLAESKGLSFEFSIDPSAAGRFLGDAVRLRQVLYNLVSNAVKFTDSGAVGVCVGYADGRLILEVADSGVGIPADKLEHVFEKFVQADASATRTTGGAGLGLAICRQLVELMGGRIQVDSVAGRGSVFTVALPLERQGEPHPLAPARQAATPASGARAYSILAAEDNEVNRLVLTTLLRQEGLSVTVVGNGGEALEAWRNGAWDLVLMDIQMPVMDGLTATRHIRREEAASGRLRTPIIAVTANALPEQRAECQQAGMDLVVTKPLEVAALFRAIDEALSGVRAVSAA